MLQFLLSAHRISPFLISTPFSHFQVPGGLLGRIRYFDKLALTDIEHPKTPESLDTQKFCSNHPKIQTRWLYSRVMCPKDADGMANSVDPDQTAPPLGAV